MHMKLGANITMRSKKSIAISLLLAGAFFSGIYYFAGKDAVRVEVPQKGNDIVSSDNNEQNSSGVARIGYFHGGRTHLFYRAYINGYFENEGIDARLITKSLDSEDLIEVPKKHEEFEEKQDEVSFLGRMTGVEIIREIEKGNLDGGVVGESSFLSLISKDSPIVAVAMLGHDEKEYPAHAFLLRKGLVIKSPEDLKGRTFVSRYSGPFDRTMVREFVESEGISIDDVTIIDDMKDRELLEAFKKGKVDGGYYHFHWVKKFVNEDDVAYVYRKLDWVNPESSLALLVFHRDYIKNNPKDVQRIVNAYAKRVQYEKNLSLKERKIPKGFGLQMVDYDSIKGMNIPQYDFPPTLREDLLHQVQDILFKHKEIDKKITIENYLDYSFVEEAMKNINK